MYFSCYSKFNMSEQDLVTTDPSSTSNSSWADVDFLTNIYGKDLLEQCPIAPVINGSTDYLDVIEEVTFSDSKGNKTSLIKGCDNHGREFVSMKVLVESKHSDEGEYKVCEKSIYTVFRRYTVGDLWVMCVSHCTPGDHVFHQLIGACSAIGTRSQNNLIHFIKCAKQGKWWKSVDDIAPYQKNSDVSVRFRCKFYI